MTNLRVAYLGNFGPPHSTENHVATALERLGHAVTRLQENDLGSWHSLRRGEHAVDLVLWTRTGWDPPVPEHLQREVVRLAPQPVVGFHLDRWWGLPRERELSEPFFTSVDLLVTADGGHADRWEEIGVEHVWMPPAVSEAECAPGRLSRRLASPIAFVGSWQHYHPEWEHRLELVEELRHRWKGQVRFWPRPGGAAVRGAMLRDLYASVRVLVGDSCLVGGASHYWSDRIPETLGRGGFLMHPWVEGLGEHFTPGEHLVCWPLGDWEALHELIGHYLDPRSERDRARIAKAGRAHVLAEHTYEVRMGQLMGECRDRGLL